MPSDGPFSILPGVDRWIAVATGAGMELSIDGVAAVLTRTSPVFAFDGGASTMCRLLDGPVQDLNLMVRRDRGHGAMEIVELGGACSLEGVTVCVVLDGAASIAGARLEALDATLDEHGTIEPQPSARVALIRVG